MRTSEPCINNYSKSSGKSVATRKVRYLLTGRGRYLLTPDSNTNPYTSILCASMAPILLPIKRILNRFPEHGETRIQLGKVSLPKDVISYTLLTWEIRRPIACCQWQNGGQCRWEMFSVQQGMFASDTKLVTKTNHRHILLKHNSRHQCPINNKTQ
jgi:hypothetical protein